MLKKCLASLLATTLVMAALALMAPAAPVAAGEPLRARGNDDLADLQGPWAALLGGLWQDLLGVFSAAACNEEDPCAPDACFPEFCPCSSDPCAQNACNPEACTGSGGGTGPGFDPHG